MSLVSVVETQRLRRRAVRANQIASGVPSSWQEERGRPHFDFLLCAHGVSVSGLDGGKANRRAGWPLALAIRDLEVEVWNLQ